MICSERKISSSVINLVVICNAIDICSVDMICFVQKNLEKSQTIRMISLCCRLIPSFSHSRQGKFPHRLPRESQSAFVNLVLSKLHRRCIQHPDKVLRHQSDPFFCTGSLQIYFFYLFILLLACENKSKSVIREDAVKQIIAYSKWETIWIKLEPPRSYGQILSQPTSFVVGSITSRCSGKEPALLPRTSLFGQGRPDTRERRKASLHLQLPPRKYVFVMSK